ncbi:MAG: 50S ribosomal protein L4 [Planctomycetaceae bacterium]|jgi:large subunit ribosomal protein L4|nr:50S ribosomal protein L4 [Planctomycetaceae bacterium]
MSSVELTVYDKSGNEIDKLTVYTELLVEHINSRLLHDAVVMYQSNLRQGSAKTKSRAEVAGHKKKMYKQKGTGNARAGHRRSGVRRGGGHIFAKRPRNWFFRLPSKALKKAARMAFVAKLNDAQVILIDTLAVDAPKTKEVVQILNALKINETVLVAIEQHNTNLYKSFRNIEGVRILPVSDLNAYEILRPKRLLMTRLAYESLVNSIISPSDYEKKLNELKSETATATGTGTGTEIVTPSP